MQPSALTADQNTADIRDVDVLVLGAGFAGLGLAVQLVRENSRSFLVLERGDDVGGTWRINTYPGLCCDVPSHLYSYSFRLNPNWSMVRSPGAEIQRYLQETAAEEGVLPHCRFGTEVTGAHWDEDRHRWRVETNNGVFTSRFLATCLGLLSLQKYPDVPGIETFAGDLFHSAGWNHDVSLVGKRVGVVGTGASAIQIVPEIASLASELIVFQRSATYILPRMNRAYTDAEKRTFQRLPETMAAHRRDIFWYGEGTFPERRLLASSVEPVLAQAAKLREEQVKDPKIREKLVPDYELGCKRILFSDNYLPTFNLEHVTLETSALASVDGHTVTSVSGNSYELDVLITATGFYAGRPPFARLIHGRDGVGLDEHWSEGMQAFQTLTVNGFPNLFVMSSANAATGHNSAVFTIEAQIRHVMEALRWSDQHAVRTIEVKREAEDAYTDAIHERAQGTVWLEGGCKSWYLDPGNGKLTLIWPDFAYVFNDEIGNFTPEAYVVERESA